MPMMPRSSRGVFQAFLSPCVAVNTPPNGGPTSSPKTSVTPRCSSPKWRAIRTDCTIVPSQDLCLQPRVIAGVNGVYGARGVSVLVNIVGRRLRLVQSLIERCIGFGRGLVMDFLDVVLV